MAGRRKRVLVESWENTLGKSPTNKLRLDPGKVLHDPLKIFCFLDFKKIFINLFTKKTLIF